MPAKWQENNLLTSHCGPVDHKFGENEQLLYFREHKRHLTKFVSAHQTIWDIKQSKKSLFKFYSTPHPLVHKREFVFRILHLSKLFVGRMQFWKDLQENKDTLSDNFVSNFDIWCWDFVL